jgi:hypothetical protein
MEIRIPLQQSLFTGRVLGWYSHGITSAVMAKVLVSQYPRAEIVNCANTMQNEHPDNVRFLADVEQWIGRKITLLRSSDYGDIFDVFDKTGWLLGHGMARCTIELKRNVREQYQQAGDVHCFGMTADEGARVERFKRDNPEIYVAFPLIDAGLTKQDCINMILRAGIEIPAMYKLGYKNNNCIGCVKGGKGYWNKIRRDFPEHFARMATQERKMNARVFKDVWLDELPPDAGRYESDFDIECGVTCNISDAP